MKAFLFACSFVLVFSCVRNPVTGEKELTFISETQERQIGKENYKTMIQAQGGPFTADPELVSYVQSVGKKLAQESHRPQLSFEFMIVNDSEINAWALPGGKIAINRGLLLELTSEAELAAVLGHEITHATARHGAKGLERSILLQGGIIALGIAVKDNRYNDILVSGASVGALLLQQKYSRGQELEADRFGIQYLAKAGYNPDAAIRLQETFLRLSKDRESSRFDELFASHPPTSERIDENIKTVDALKAEMKCFDFEGKEEYEKKIAELKKQKEAYDECDKAKEALEENKLQKAFGHINKALQAFPKEAHFWTTLGTIYAKEQNSKKALEAYSQAVSLNKDYYLTYLNRGVEYKKLGNRHKAKKDLEKSIELLPTGEAHEVLGRIFVQERDFRSAYHHFEIASHANSEAGARARKILSQF